MAQSKSQFTGLNRVEKFLSRWMPSQPTCVRRRQRSEILSLIFHAVAKGIRLKIKCMFRACLLRTAPTGYNDLPKELRLMIWEYALPQARVILVERKRLSSRVKDVANSSSGGGEMSQRWGFRSPCKPPRILYICKDSFEVASKHYQRAFGTEHNFPEVVSISCL
jgi:hypothetical protein